MDALSEAQADGHRQAGLGLPGPRHLPHQVDRPGARRGGRRRTAVSPLAAARRRLQVRPSLVCPRRLLFSAARASLQGRAGALLHRAVPPSHRSQHGGRLHAPHQLRDQQASRRLHDRRGRRRRAQAVDLFAPRLPQGARLRLRPDLEQHQGARRQDNARRAATPQPCVPLPPRRRQHRLQLLRDLGLRRHSGQEGQALAARGQPCAFVQLRQPARHDDQAGAHQEHDASDTLAGVPQEEVPS
mmetsp:Transcript_39846/g.96763  ORF Transcript_39846/g.96763 Transcript_39846/m.96763 type:complete len:243 (+) Transcript_39846:864-1592(+)